MLSLENEHVRQEGRYAVDDEKDFSNSSQNGESSPLEAPLIPLAIVLGLVGSCTGAYKGYYRGLELGQHPPFGTMFNDLCIGGLGGVGVTFGVAFALFVIQQLYISYIKGR